MLIRLCTSEPNVLLPASGTVHLIGEDAETVLCGREMPEAAPGRVQGAKPDHSAWCHQCLEIERNG